jgi:hypothetical protein
MQKICGFGLPKDKILGKINIDYPCRKVNGMEARCGTLRRVECIFIIFINSYYQAFSEGRRLNQIVKYILCGYKIFSDFSFSFSIIIYD